MKIKSKALIKYFKTKNVNEKNIPDFLFVKLGNLIDSDIEELKTIINTYSSYIKRIDVIPKEAIQMNGPEVKEFNDFVSSIPSNIKIGFLNMNFWVNFRYR